MVDKMVLVVGTRQKSFAKSIIEVLHSIHEYEKETGETAGVVKCPRCGDKFSYHRAQSNGHIWGACVNGDLSIMQ